VSEETTFPNVQSAPSVTDDDTIVLGTEIVNAPLVLHVNGVPHIVTGNLEVATADVLTPEGVKRQVALLLLREPRESFGLYSPISRDELGVMIGVLTRMYERLPQGAGKVAH
jgi:hypothetical protein